MTSINTSTGIVLRPFSRTEPATVDTSGAKADSVRFQQSLNQPEVRARKGTGTSESTNYNADDTTRSLVRLDNNSTTRLNQSQFSNGRGASVQAAGRLPAPPALFETGSTQDTGATRDQILSRRTTAPEMGAASAVGAFVDATTASTARTASSIASSEAAFLLSQQNIQSDLQTSSRYATTPDIARDGTGVPDSGRIAAAAAVDSGSIAPQVGQQLVRQYQQVGASKSTGSDGAVNVVA